MNYPPVLRPELVGSYPALQPAGGGYVWDAVLEYRIWCSPLSGADDLADGSDYYYAFGAAEDAINAARQLEGSSAPIALILQEEYIEEASEGVYVHIKVERTTEWPIEFLRRPRREPETITKFFSAKTREEGITLIRGDNLQSGE